MDRCASPLVFWTTGDWAGAIARLPVDGPLPCRTVLVPRERVAHALRRELLRAGLPHALAGTRFVAPIAAAVEVLRSASVAGAPGEESLRPPRLLTLFGQELPLADFPLDCSVPSRAGMRPSPRPFSISRVPGFDRMTSRRP